MNLRVAVTVASATLLSAACGGNPGKSGTRTWNNKPGPVVALSLPALDGGSIDTSSYRGRVVVLHLLTTTTIAGQEIAGLRAAHERYGERIAVVAVVLDQTDYRMVAPWRQAEQIPYLVTLASAAVRGGKSILGRIRQVPTTVILDRRGRLRHRFDAPVPRQTLDRILAALMEKR